MSGLRSTHRDGVALLGELECDSDGVSHGPGRGERAGLTFLPSPGVMVSTVTLCEERRSGQSRVRGHDPTAEILQSRFAASEESRSGSSRETESQGRRMRKGGGGRTP